MQDIKVDEALWASNMLPEGVVERWFIADGAIVAAGDPMAETRIEDALHDIENKIAPAALKYEELRASLLVQVLPTEVFNSVADRIAPPQYFAQINEAFIANNSPVLASAFTPKQA